MRRKTKERIGRIKGSSLFRYGIVVAGVGFCFGLALEALVHSEPPTPLPWSRTDDKPAPSLSSSVSEPRTSAPDLPSAPSSTGGDGERAADRRLAPGDDGKVDPVDGQVTAPPRPRIAVVIDDLGLHGVETARAIALPAPVTLAFLPYAADTSLYAGRARVAGHEVLVHVPMEPLDAAVDPGPAALLVGLSEAALRQRLIDNIERVPGAVGINNHMGSRLTADHAAMAVVMAEIGHRGLLFLDSRTTAETVAEAAATAAGVGHVRRHVFLDNDRDPERIRARLRETETAARASGLAVAIGHPYPETLDSLEAWIPEAERRGFTLVPISEAVAGASVRTAGH